MSSAGCLSRLPFVGGPADDNENEEAPSTESEGESESNEEFDDVDSDDLDTNDGEPRETQSDDDDGGISEDITLTAFENSQYGYSIEYPEQWEFDGDDLSAVEARHPDDQGFLRVTAYIAEEELSSEEVLEEFIANTEANVDDVDEYDREATELASGHDATALSLWYDTGDDEYVTENLVAIIGRLTYHVEFTVLEDTVDETTEEIVEGSLGSFTVDSAPSEAVTADELGNRETFEHEEGYSIEHPAKWEDQEVGEGHIRFDSPDASADLSVRVFDDSGYPLEMWVESHLEDLEVNPDVTVFGEHETETASGVSAVLLGIESENPEEGEQLIARELVTVAEGFVAFVALSVTALLFTSDVADEADEIVTSIKF
jgi:hypothetical protein